MGFDEYERGERVSESHTFRNGSDTLKVSGIVSVGNHRNNSLIDALNPFSNYHRKAIILLGLATRTRRLRHSHNRRVRWDLGSSSCPALRVEGTWTLMGGKRTASSQRLSQPLKPAKAPSWMLCPVNQRLLWPSTLMRETRLLRRRRWSFAATGFTETSLKQQRLDIPSLGGSQKEMVRKG